MSAGAIPERFPAGFGDVVADAMDSMMEMVLGSRLTFAERLDPDALARAARLLLDLEPVLGCWWDESFGGADWVRCADLDEQVVFSTADSDDPDRDAAAFHGTPFDPKGPRLAVLLLRSRDHDDLCVRFDHVAGDGWSAREVTHLLAETYSRVLDDPDYVPVPRTAPRPTHADVWAALTDEQRALKTQAPPMSASKWAMKAQRGRGSGYAVRTLTLAPERVAAIRAYAHDRGATVNEALVASAVRSAASMFPLRPGVRPGVSISADTRRIARNEGLNRLANIATTQIVLMDYRHGESFDETLRHVIDGVKPYRDSLWSITASQVDTMPAPVAMRAMFAFMTATMRLLHGMSLVCMNVGPFDEKRLAFGEVLPVAAIGTGPATRFAGLPALISSYRDAMTIWMGFREEHIAPEVVERYLAGIDEQLATALEPGMAEARMAGWDA